MGDARFHGLYMVLPPIGITLLFVFIMQALIRLWMVNAPGYVRKYVRFPLNEELTDFINSKMEKPVLQGYQANIPHGYPGQPPVYSNHGYVNQGYQGKTGNPQTGYPGSAGYQNRGYYN